VCGSPIVLDHLNSPPTLNNVEVRSVRPAATRARHTCFLCVGGRVGKAGVLGREDGCGFEVDTKGVRACALTLETPPQHR
jgi:hypothetical protein